MADIFKVKTTHNTARISLYNHTFSRQGLILKKKVHCMFDVKNTHMYSIYNPKAQIFVRMTLKQFLSYMY